MVYNDTTSNLGLIQSCEDWARLGLAQISGNTNRLKKFTRLINNNYHKVVSMILESMDGWDFDDANLDNTAFIKTYDITANTQSVKLPLSDKILKIKRAEITFDGTNWYRMAPMDLNEYGGVTTAAEIANNFSTSQPFYDLVGNYVYIYPIPTASVTGGLKLWIVREIDEFATSDTTQEPGFAEPFHDMLAIGSARDYALQEGLAHAGDLTVVFNDYEARLRQFYGNRETDRHLVMKSADESYG